MKKSIAILGGGPSALMLAAQLNEKRYDINIYEKNAALGRKFLVAGSGGFNLTHSEEINQFISRYTPSDFFKNSITNFSNIDLRNWLSKTGIETYVGTSKRVFPKKGIKPIEVLDAILNVLKKKEVRINTNHIWKGWEKEELVFETGNQTIHIKQDFVVFCLGGSSWKVTGSDGTWINYFQKKGIETIPFQASNCAFEIKWKQEFISIAEGKILKNISIKCNTTERKGELVITKFGLEGGAIYAMSPQIREQLNKTGNAIIYLDLKPSHTTEQLLDKFRMRGNRSIKKLLIDRLKMDEVQIDLLKTILTKEDFTSPETLAEKIKNLPLTITSSAPIDDAISTVGGISLEEIDEHFQLKKLPNNFCIGEMLDWDAPTGGYLLQGCFSMAYSLSQFLNR